MFSSMADTTILIRDPKVVRDIERLAQRTGKPPEDVVAEAISAQLGEPAERTPEEIAERRKRVEEALAAWDALPHDGEPLTDDDLYDEQGLPR
jgi:hypothetical protein